LAKSFTPNMNSPYNTACAGCMGCSCSFRATYLCPLHQAAPVPECCNNILVGKVSGYAGGNGHVIGKSCTARSSSVFLNMVKTIAVASLSTGASHFLVTTDV
jgi:hypothetical protein